MMKGWKEYKLGNLIEYYIGGGWGNEVENENYPIPAYVIRGTDIEKAKYGDYSSIPFRFHKKSNFRSRKLQAEDIVFEVSGGSSNEGVGKTLLIKDNLVKELKNVICASFCKLARPKSELVNNAYLNYLFEYFRISKLLEIWELRSASNIVNYNWEAFLKYQKIHLPPLPTQRKIAKILSAYDDLIENNLKRIKLLEEMAQNAFNNWYTNNTSFEEVNLGSIIGHEIGGGWGAEEQSDEYSQPAYVIRGTDIDELPNGKIEKVPFRFHKKSNLASRKLQDGDIIFEVSGGSSYEGVAKTLLVTDELLKQFDNAVMPASFCKLARPIERKYSHFLFLFLRFLRKIKGTEVFEIRSASNIVNYNWTAFLKFQKINKPSDNELEKLNKIVEPIYKQIYNLGNQNQRLKEARDILLPRLMTGMIDVEK